MAVVTVTELASYMSGVSMTDAAKRSAQLILEGVQSELEAFLNRPVTARHLREVVQVEADGYARLSVTPVGAVLRVIGLDGVERNIVNSINLDPMIELELPDGTVLPQYDTVPLDSGTDLIAPGGCYVYGGHRQAIVEYVGGGGDFMAPYIGSIRIAILRVASREFQQMNDDTKSLRNASAADAPDSTPMQRGWAEDELAKFDRIRRRVVL